MVSLKELERLVQRSRSGLKILIVLERCRHRIMVDRAVKAVDEEGKTVAWSAAFPIPPHMAIDQCGIRKIIVMCGGRELANYSTWRSLMESLDQLGADCP